MTTESAGISTSKNFNEIIYLSGGIYLLFIAIIEFLTDEKVAIIEIHDRVKDAAILEKS